MILSMPATLPGRMLEGAPARVVPASRERKRGHGLAWRIFVSVWLVYTLHFASDVVRETYLALALGEAGTIRVDPYLGLHPDLFAIPGRGAFINNNPGASMLAALPYAAARPLVEALLRAKPELARPKPPSTYADPRPNRTRFMNEARARGLDIKLGLAAGIMQAGLMAPLGALAAVAVFLFLRRRLRDERKALWLTLLYAFATPVFFRSAFLNQNAIVAHCVLLAYMLAVGAEARAAGTVPGWALIATGALMGLAVLCDYSGVPLLLVFGAWLAWRGAAATRLRGLARAAALFGLGAAGPVAVLLLYQYAAFGNPFFPAQRYMPATHLSVRGWNGIAFPAPELLWRNLLDPRYGLFAFAPMLLLALAAPFLRRREGGPTGAELTLAFGAALALYLFASSVEYALLQWNTGVRYLVPAVPLLFFALVPVLLRLPRWLLWSALLPTIAISWSVAMARESVPVSLALIFLRGFQLPWMEVLRKTAAGYLPFLGGGTSPLPLFCLAGAVLWLVWRGARLEGLAQE